MTARRRGATTPPGPAGSGPRCGPCSTASLSSAGPARPARRWSATDAAPAPRAASLSPHGALSSEGFRWWGRCPRSRPRCPLENAPCGFLRRSGRNGREIKDSARWNQINIRFGDASGASACPRRAARASARTCCPPGLWPCWRPNVSYLACDMDKGTGKDKDRRIPGATYRVLLTKDFTFKQATELVEYWHKLGITDLYAAPFLKARPGSVHGYDVVAPTALNPEIGTEDDLGQLHEALASHGMGLVMDVVPNHMCISTNDNVWWNNVLENGPSSPFARYFDIDWHPPKTELHDKVLLPILGDQYGRVLEAGELQVREADGGFVVEYYQRRFPVGPGTYPVILRGMLARLARADTGGTAAHALGELLALAESLPPRSATGADDVARRQRDKETLKQRLRALLAEPPAARAALDEDLRDLNGTKGQPRSFDRLEQLLAVQAYRLSYWRVAAEQINYRRFFEINDLAAIRIEEPEVLAAVHGKPLELLKKGWVTGLRVDHVDGLREPRRYLDELRAKTEGAYVVVEKILGRDERLPRSWATEGTTGYEFLNILNALFVSRSGERALRSLYDGLRTVKGGLPDVVYEAKRLVLSASMSSELSVLVRRLDRISEQHRWSRDFTAGTLLQVLADTIACFPVYRTYIAAGDTEVAPQELQYIREALLRARRRNPTIESSAFDFLSEVLLMRDPEGLSEGDRAERRDFVLRFQQLTGPVMAKGLEATSFYRYFPLLSQDAVGGYPYRFGLSIELFHLLM